MKIELVISFDQTTGQVGVSGPINDRILCYGLLEMAREAIAKAGQEKKNGIVPIRANLPGAN
jgi:hypothetical protein